MAGNGVLARIDLDRITPSPPADFDAVIAKKTTPDGGMPTTPVSSFARGSVPQRGAVAVEPEQPSQSAVADIRTTGAVLLRVLGEGV